MLDVRINFHVILLARQFVTLISWQNNVVIAYLIIPNCNFSLP